jgi:hypothetical protein
VPYQDALARRYRANWTDTQMAKPAFLGARAINEFPLGDLVPYIDWSPFFMAWELKGKYPDIFKDATVGKEARDLFDKAQALLHKMIDKKQIQLTLTKPIGRLQYLAGLGLNFNQGTLIQDDMLVYRRFPEELFAGSEARRQMLRLLIERSKPGK